MGDDAFCLLQIITKPRYYYQDHYCQSIYATRCLLFLQNGNVIDINFNFTGRDYLIRNRANRVTAKRQTRPSNSRCQSNS